MADGRSWLLRTAHSAYHLAIDEHGLVQHLYWGPLLTHATDHRGGIATGGRIWERVTGICHEEYPSWGDANYNEPCLKASLADRTRLVAPRYLRHEIVSHPECAELVITLRDQQCGLEVALHYRPIAEFDLIERWAVIHNGGSTAVTLEQVLSGSWFLPVRDNYRLTTLAGAWGVEFQVQEFTLPLGKQLLESRRGITSHHANPWFALDDGATETNGDVWFASLAYSGNWKIVIERNAYGQVIASGGLHDFDFAWQLGPDESLETPRFIGGFTNLGRGEASRLLHRYQRNRVLPNSELRPVLYNAWEFTEFAVNQENQCAAASMAAELGIELFVVDDGWFRGRNHDRAGLGDWEVDRQKFPNGLSPLVRHVRSLGMDFGLWVEPEMVNPNSDLYRAHPDWIYHFPGRPTSELRSQLVLNVARHDVQEFIFGALDRLLREHDIGFLKWDHNRPISEPGWPSAPAGRDREMWVRHVWGVYDILRRLRQAHPRLRIESCASGGGCVDMGIMRYTDQFWASDNTDAADNVAIFDGFSRAYAPSAKMSWVTDVVRSGSPAPLLSYRFHSAMMGSLGIGADLARWTPENRDEAARLIATYKALRQTIQRGDLYRPELVQNSPLAIFQFVNPERTESVVFLFRGSGKVGTLRTLVRLQGLDSQVTYVVEDPQGTHSGAALAHRGLPIEIPGSFSSRIVQLRRSPS